MGGGARSLLVFALLCAFAPSRETAAQELRLPEEKPAAKHSITGGILLDRKGIPSERLLVTLTPANGAGNLQEYADSSGRFTFKDVPAGGYVVTVRAPEGTAYEDGTAEVTLYDSTSSHNYTVTVTLKLRGERRVMAAPGTVAVDPDAGVPKKAREAYERGAEAARANKGDEAVARFREALALAPDYRAALNDLGVQLLKLDRAKEAVAPLSRAAELGPNAFAPHLNLALALLAADDAEAAEAAAARALEIEPGSSRALCAVGRVALRRGKVAEAVASLRRAVDAGDEMQSAAAFALGEAYQAAGDAASAAEAYRMVTYLEPGTPRADEAHARLHALGAE
jgi:Flp pilus assembly protein TadD